MSLAFFKKNLQKKNFYYINTFKTLKRIMEYIFQAIKWFRLTFWICLYINFNLVFSEDEFNLLSVYLYNTIDIEKRTNKTQQFSHVHCTLKKPQPPPEKKNKNRQLTVFFKVATVKQLCNMVVWTFFNYPNLLHHFVKNTATRKAFLYLPCRYVTYSKLHIIYLFLNTQCIITFF